MAAGTGRVQGDPLKLLDAELLGRYVIEAVIAQGGMSLVYRGLDERLQRPVCVKVFHRIDPRDPAYQTSYEHFVQEAFALSQLSHPNTLRIYDFGYLDWAPRSPFQVSELLDGGTLAQRLRTIGLMTPMQALDLIEPLVGALSEAHARGIIHRDIKPSNILFAVAGTRHVPKLVDFGIAKAQIDDAERALPNQARDTSAAAGCRMSLYSPGWAAPEQLRASPIGPSADVFALGLVLYYALTGKSMYATKTEISAFEDRVTGDRHIEKCLAEQRVPPALADVIRHACREKVELRTPSAEAFLAAVDDAVHAPTLAAVPSVDFDLDLDLDAERARMPTGKLPRLEPEPPLLAFDERAGDQLVAAGRRVRVLPVEDHMDAGGPAGPLRSGARFRLTLLPDGDGHPRLHVKGLNCFVARPGARPSSAASVDADVELELLAPDRTRLDVLRCVFGHPGDDDARVFPLGEVSLAVPARIPHAVILDLGPGREMVLLHRAAAPAPHVQRGSGKR